VLFNISQNANQIAYSQLNQVKILGQLGKQQQESKTVNLDALLSLIKLKMDEASLGATQMKKMA
jgi:hypothetical protein